MRKIHNVILVGPYMAPSFPSEFSKHDKLMQGCPYKGRLPQIVGQAALAANVLAGGVSLLNAGGAMAVSCTGPNGAHFDIVGTYTSCSSPVGAPPAGNQFVTIDTKFDPELNGPLVGKTEYKITSLTNGHFLKVHLDSDFDLPSGTVTKTLWADAAYTIPILTASPLVSNSGDATALIDIIGNPTTIWVRDDYNIAAGGQLDNYTNTFQTPGPLPILGAGAAFGFSRKLRSRIKAGHAA